MSPPDMPDPSEGAPQLDDDELPIHKLLAIVREEVVAVSARFGRGVSQAVKNADAARSSTPSSGEMIESVLVQALNLIGAAFRRDHVRESDGERDE